MNGNMAMFCCCCCCVCVVTSMFTQVLLWPYNFALLLLSFSSCSSFEIKSVSLIKSVTKFIKASILCLRFGTVRDREDPKFFWSERIYMHAMLCSAPNNRFIYSIGSHAVYIFSIRNASHNHLCACVSVYVYKSEQNITINKMILKRKMKNRKEKRFKSHTSPASSLIGKKKEVSSYITFDIFLLSNSCFLFVCLSLFKCLCLLES